MGRKVGIGTKNWGAMTNEEKQQGEIELHGPLPEIGDYYIWGEGARAPDIALEICRVTKIVWNLSAEEWFVYSIGNRDSWPSDGRETFNDLSRWNKMTRKLSPEELSL